MKGKGGAAVGEILEAHRQWCRLYGLRPATIDQRARVLRRLAVFTGRDPLEAQQCDIEAFLSRLAAAESRATELSHLRSFYRWAVQAGHVRASPVEGIPRPRVGRRVPRPIGTAELAQAVHSAPERVRPWLVLAAWAGLRCSEIARVRGEDVWRDHDPPALVVPDGKGGQPGVVPCHPLVLTELDRLPRRGWCFPRADGRSGPVAGHRVSQLGNEHLRACGIDATMHQLRHWFGTAALRASGGNLRVAQELLRHRSPVSTAIYTAVSSVERAAAVAELPGLPRPEMPAQVALPFG